MTQQQHDRHAKIPTPIKTKVAVTDGSSPKPKHCTYRLVGDNFCALTHLISTAAQLHSRSENEYRKKCWSDRYILIGAMVAATAGEFSMRYTTCLVSRKPCPDSQRSPRHHVSRIHYPIFKFGALNLKKGKLFISASSATILQKKHTRKSVAIEALDNIYNTLQQHFGIVARNRSLACRRGQSLHGF